MAKALYRLERVFDIEVKHDAIEKREGDGDPNEVRVDLPVPLDIEVSARKMNRDDQHPKSEHAIRDGAVIFVQQQDGEKATEVTSNIWPLNVCISLPKISQIFAVPSSLPVKIYFPSGEKTTDVILSTWPMND